MASHLSVVVCLLISGVIGQFNNNNNGQFGGQMPGQFGGQMPGQMPGQLGGLGGQMSGLGGQLGGGLGGQLGGGLGGQLPGQAWGQNQGLGQQFPPTMGGMNPLGGMTPLGGMNPLNRGMNPLRGVNPMRTAFGNTRNPAWWNGGFGPWSGVGRQQYQTCIGRNNFGDEMRITFTLVNNQRNNFAFRFNQPRDIKFSAVILASANSNLQGEFRFAITEFGRVEDSCISGALGSILTANQWWNQNRIRGVVGSPVRITRGSRAASSEYLENLNWEDIIGRGFVLCPSTQLTGSSCYDAIPLCCKIGRDSQDATVGFNVGQFSGVRNGMGGGNIMGGGIGGGNIMGGGIGGGLGGGIGGGNIGGGLGGMGAGGLLTGANTDSTQQAGTGSMGTLQFAP